MQHGGRIANENMRILSAACIVETGECCHFLDRRRQLVQERHVAPKPISLRRYRLRRARIGELHGAIMYIVKEIIITSSAGEIAVSNKALPWRSSISGEIVTAGITR